MPFKHVNFNPTQPQKLNSVAACSKPDQVLGMYYLRQLIQNSRGHFLKCFIHRKHLPCTWLQLPVPGSVCHTISQSEVAASGNGCWEMGFSGKVWEHWAKWAIQPSLHPLSQSATPWYGGGHCPIKRAEARFNCQFGWLLYMEWVEVPSYSLTRATKSLGPALSEGIKSVCLLLIPGSNPPHVADYHFPIHTKICDALMNMLLHKKKFSTISTDLGSPSYLCCESTGVILDVLRTVLVCIHTTVQKVNIVIVQIWFVSCDSTNTSPIAWQQEVV